MDETMLRERVGVLQEERLTLANALHTILQDTDDADTMRTAIRALASTDVGLHLMATGQL